jgi:hypothetical protein
VKGALEDMDELFMKSLHRATWNQLRGRGGRKNRDSGSSLDSAVNEKVLGLVHIELGEKHQEAKASPY